MCRYTEERDVSAPRLLPEECARIELEFIVDRRAAVAQAVALLNIHYKSFKAVEPFAREYGHPEPCDTRGWSQILVSALTGLKGIKRQKGADLEDGSDVKGACTWGAIDTPRFNGCIKAGTKSALAGTMASLDAQPFLFFVLWDCEPSTNQERCRIWVVRPQKDEVFRKMCGEWYRQCASGEITEILSNVVDEISG